MLIGNKSFPYPLLRNGDNNKDYKSTFFKLEYEQDENPFIIKDGTLILRGIHFTNTNNEIKKLIDESSAKVICEIDCSKTVYREFVEISEAPNDITVPINNLSGAVTVSAYMIAKKEINDFYSDDFVEDYDGYKFHFNPNNIIAADDGIRFDIEIDEHKYDKMASIFTIIQQDDAGDITTYNDEGNRIVIYLKPQYFKIYDNMKNESKFNNLFFATLVIPVLANCLQDIKSFASPTESVEEICDDKKWFKSILARYKDIHGEELDMDEFLSRNCFELSQELMGKATCSSLLDFYSILDQSDGEDAEDE